MRRPLRVAVCADYREERWPSMDRVADSLLAALQAAGRGQVQAEDVRPPFRRRASRLHGGRIAANLDRGLNRLLDYPAHVARLADDYDVFHVVDHSYAQLVHRLPAERTIVTCHDLDTFRSVLQPADEPRSALFTAMTRHIQRGLSRAALVACDTNAVRTEIVEAGLAGPDRAVVVSIGVDPVFAAGPDPAADAEAERLLPRAGGGTVDLLHVGSVAARKRIDVLIEVVATLARSLPEVRLVRVGGAFTREQQAQADASGVTPRCLVLPSLDDRTLAAVYRRAALVLFPSAREGFGLPLVEALACGTPVVASDLPVLREVGGPAVEYYRLGDIHAWSGGVLRLLDERRIAPDRWADRRTKGMSWAARYSWTRYAERMMALYRELGDASADRRVA